MLALLILAYICDHGLWLKRRCREINLVFVLKGKFHKIELGYSSAPKAGCRKFIRHSKNETRQWGNEVVYVFKILLLGLVG